MITQATGELAEHLTAFNISSSENDYMYMNTTIGNPTNKDIPAELNITREQPILDRMEDWEWSVVRFKIPMSTVPLRRYATNGDTGLLLNISDGDVPNGTDFPVEIVNATNLSEGSVDYSAIFNYDLLVGAINVALKEALRNILADDLIQVNTFFKVNGETSLIEFHTPVTQNDIEDGTQLKTVFAQSSPIKSGGEWLQNVTGLRLWVNQPLHELLGGFNWIKLYESGSIVAKPVNFDYIFYPHFSLADTYKIDADPSVDEPGNSKDAFSMIRSEANYQSLHAWSDVSRLFILTGMPVEHEVILATSKEGTPVSLDILTDFQIPPAPNAVSEPVFFFATQPRWGNFMGTGALKLVQYRVYIQRKDLTFEPLFIAPGNELNLKLEFRRRKNPRQYQRTYHNTIRI